MKRIFDVLSNKDVRIVLATITVIGCFILLYLMIIKPIPPENKDVVLTSVGFVFGGALSGVIGYYFGASKESSPPKN